jgi:hypothetical protein
MSEDDPFEELDDAVGDRDGNPFESLDGESDDSATPESDPEAADQTGRDQPDTEQFREALDARTPSERQSPLNTAADSATERDPFAAEQAQSDTPAPSEGAERAPSEPADSSEMAFDVGRRDNPDPSGEEFLSDVGRREGDPFDSFQDAFDEMDVDKLDPDVVWQELASAESRGSVGDARERTYADVSAHNYCEGCRHFSSPPDVSCGHKGTEIVEFLDMETVRVVDCPIVTEREKLDDDDGFADS